METTLSLLSTIRQLEVELHQPAVRADRARLEALLHADFVEFSIFGRTYTKADMLRDMPIVATAYPIGARDFAVRLLTPLIALLTYRSAYRRPDGQWERHALRSSVWHRASEQCDQWLLAFHQGTRTEDFEL